LKSGFGNQVDGVVGHVVRCQNLIGIPKHLFTQILVENKPKGIVPEFIRPHFTPKVISNIPKFLIELLFLRHKYLIND